MDHDHDSAHAHDHADANMAVKASLDAAQDPGRSTHSALLRKPEHAVASGLLTGRGLGANTAAQGSNGGQTERAPSQAPGNHDPHKGVPAAGESALERFFQTNSDLIIPAHCSDTQRWLAGAYFPGTASNAERFIRTQHKDLRGELEGRLGRLKAVWKSAARVRGAQANLNLLWNPWSKNWEKSRVALDKITEVDCDTILRDLRKQFPDRKDWKGRPWKDDISISGGICATAVTHIFSKMTGLWVTGHGKDWESKLQAEIKSGALPYRQKLDLSFKDLPPGSVIVWGPGGTQYGHVCVTVGTHWFSDYKSAPGKQGGLHKLQAIFVPDAPLE